MEWIPLAIRSILQPWSVRQRQLAGARPPLGDHEFVTEIAERGGDPDAAFLILAHLKDWGLEQGFSPYPDDDLERVYGIAEEELEADLLSAILKRLSLPLPTTANLTRFGPVQTPAQIAQLVAQIRRRGPD